jgi:hypothetical protein
MKKFKLFMMNYKEQETKIKICQINEILFYNLLSS